ncbi:MAG: DUF1566 domain-containing protein, partial [bacterium]|nr:DUF1566 domain-containing protein [bacterium]
IFILYLITIFFIPSPLQAASRGIAVSSDRQSRLGLIIGNSSYRSAPLNNPVNDANDIAIALKKLDFNVILKTDANRRTMLEAINRFGRLLKKSDVGLFFFAGHGMQVNGINYLIPVGAYVQDETDVEFEGVAAQRILGKMEIAGCEVNIIFLDACRNNPFKRSFRGGASGLAKMDAPKGAFIAYATSPGNVASDGTERNSPFTRHLLINISIADAKIEDVMKRVRSGVLKHTNARQMPWQASSLTGDFYFLRSSDSKNAGVLQSEKPDEISRAPDSSYETLFWESIKDSKDNKMFKAYIDQFPDGVFVKLAEINIQKYSKDEGVINQPSVKSEKTKPEAKEKNLNKKTVYAHQQASPIQVALESKNSEAPRKESQIKKFIQQYDIYNKQFNPGGAYAGRLVDKDDMAIRDGNTGLVWQKKGSAHSISFRGAKRYIADLNKEHYAGYSDWRLPCIEELVTLLEKETVDGRHISSLFGKTRAKYWSNSKSKNVGALSNHTGAWIVDFETGNIKQAKWYGKSGPTWQARYTKYDKNYVRATRSDNQNHE